MKVILNEHVPNLGERGQILEVKPGFARNYLIPKGLAYEATAANVARFQAEQKRWEARQARERTSAAELASRLTGVELTFKRRAGEADALYGSVTATDIAEALAAKGLPVDRRKVVLPQHIKRLGTYTVELHLHRDVTVPILVHVEPMEPQG
ncbi:MAG: 50S ribosomal protein L9 [Thermoanaerobaculum sp.]|nr:50S ribosomal protein L9 [Thermoanaerobaculum sp.]MDW7968673.1 50S ribosomal protein L9 [Thermoanaerobaculum sp.]